MSFRGVDPGGLVNLAAATAAATGRAQESVRPALAILDRNGLAGEVAALATAVGRIDIWGGETADNLRWRAKAISAGQNRWFNIGAILRARFASEAVFTASSRDDAYQTWLSPWHRQEQRIAAAVSDIAGWLSQSLTDWDVSNNDLQNIRLTLEGLTNQELDCVLAGLTPRHLERWITEMGHSFNGFSRAEKQEVFALLATNASGISLSRIHSAALAAGGPSELIDLGRAIGAHSADSVVVEFVRQTLSRDLSDIRFSTLVLGPAISGIEGQDASDTVTALITSHDTALPIMLVDAILSDEASIEMPTSVMTRSTRGEDLTAAFTAVVSLLTRRSDLRELLETRGNSHDGNREAQTSEVEEQLLVAATEFLKANPEAVFADLATNVDTDGDWTSEYWHRLVARGDGAAITGILDSLRGGGTIDLVRFTDRGPDPSYQFSHARNLAFAAATLNRGMTATAADAKGDIDAIGRVAGVALTVIAVLSSGAALAEGALGGGAGWSIEDQATRVGADIDNQLTTLIDTATTRLRPPDGSDLTGLPDAGNAMLAWTSVYTGLLPFA